MKQDLPQCQPDTDGQMALSPLAKVLTFLVCFLLRGGGGRLEQRLQVCLLSEDSQPVFIAVLGLVCRGLVQDVNQSGEAE